MLLKSTWSITYVMRFEYMFIGFICSLYLLMLQAVRVHEFSLYAGIHIHKYNWTNDLKSFKMLSNILLWIRIFSHFIWFWACKIRIYKILYSGAK